MRWFSTVGHEIDEVGESQCANKKDAKGKPKWQGKKLSVCTIQLKSCSRAIVSIAPKGLVSQLQTISHQLPESIPAIEKEVASQGT